MSTDQSTPDHWADFTKSLVEDPTSKLTPEVKEVFIKYAGVPSDQVAQHVREVRDRAFKIFPYPCIGQFNFLDFGISTTPKYHQVLEGIKTEGKTLLDVGCCFGQDLRKLVHDGADPANLTGFEMEKGFTDLGYDLFYDKETLKSSFVHGDFFTPIPDLEGKAFDYVHASSFFHLFNWSEQVEVMRKVVGLLKQGQGSMIFGRQAGAKTAGVLKHEKAKSGEFYRHDEDSFARIVEEATKGTWAEGRVGSEAKMFEKVVAGREPAVQVMMNFAVVVK